MKKKQGVCRLLLIGALLCVFFTGCGGTGESESGEGSRLVEESGENGEAGRLTEKSGESGENSLTGEETGNQTECGISGADTGETEWPRDFEEVKEKLEALPRSGEELKELAGTESCPVPLYEIAPSNNYAGQYVTEPEKDFRLLVMAGEAAEILLMQYTVEGDIILDYLNFDGTSLCRVTDCSRDKFAGNRDSYYEYYVYDSVWFETRTDGEGETWEVLYGLLEGDMAVEIFRMPAEEGICNLPEAAAYAE